MDSKSSAKVTNDSAGRMPAGRMRSVRLNHNMRALSTVDKSVTPKLDPDNPTVNVLEIVDNQERLARLSGIVNNS